MNVNYLTTAGALNFLASVTHIAIIFGGAQWYRFFGAGEAMARMAEHGSLQPTLMTLCVSLVFAIWGAFAWSAAGVLPEFPLSKAVLILVTLVYLIRGTLGLIAPFVSSHPQITDNSLLFWVWSSAICLLIGFVHLKGIINKWFL